MCRDSFIRTNTHTCTHVHTHTHAHIHAHTYACTHIYLEIKSCHGAALFFEWGHSHWWIHCSWSYVHESFIRTHTHTRTYAHAHTHVHIHAHTHKRGPQPLMNPFLLIICAKIQWFAYTHTQAHTHKYTHTHAHAYILSFFWSQCSLILWVGP